MLSVCKILPKYLFVLFFCLWLSNPLTSQDKTSFFGIKAGPSFPLGNYKKASLDDGSFALTGYNLTLEGAWFFHPRFGISASVALNEHSVDVSMLGWEIVQSDPFIEGMYIRSDLYLMVTGMIGPYFKIPAYRKLHVTGKLQGGVLYGRSPYQLYKPQYFLVASKWYEKTSTSDWGFAINGGAGIRYDISNCFGLLLDSDFTYGNLDFRYTTASGGYVNERRIFYWVLSLGLQVNL